MGVALYLHFVALRSEHGKADYAINCELNDSRAREEDTAVTISS